MIRSGNRSGSHRTSVVNDVSRTQCCRSLPATGQRQHSETEYDYCSDYSADRTDMDHE
jgi:hypothetical protein